jgi:hypothetical protein
MDYTKVAEAKIRDQVAHDILLSQQSIDSFIELSPLTLAQARARMFLGYDDVISGLIIYAPAEIAMVVLSGTEDTVQLQAFAYRTQNQTKWDITGSVTWLMSGAGVVTVTNGLVEAVGAGTVEVYARIDGTGSFESNRISITVA